MQVRPGLVRPDRAGGGNRGVAGIQRLDFHVMQLRIVVHTHAAAHHNGSGRFDDMPDSDRRNMLLAVDLSAFAAVLAGLPDLAELDAVAFSLAVPWEISRPMAAPVATKLKTNRTPQTLPNFIT